MSRAAAIIAAILALSSSACSEGPADQRSLRASLADWIAPPGHQPNGGTAPASAATPEAQVVQGAYQGDAARLQAGVSAVNVSQVTIWGGQVNVRVGGGLSMDTEWRPAGGVVSATVAECETISANIPRADKAGSATIFLTRINGIIYVSPFASGNCQAPGQAQSYPGYGRFPLSVSGRVQGATLQISSWGAGAGYPMPYPATGSDPR